MKRGIFPNTLSTARHWLAIAAAALACAFASTTAQAQEVESSEARAFLVTPLSFVKQFDLDFGDIIPGDNGGTVTVIPNGSVTTTGDVIHIDGTQQAGLFWGYGAVNQLVRIQFDANEYTLTRIGGTETMTMTTTTIGSIPPVPLGANPRIFRIVNPDGYFNFGMGATLDVDGDQAPGVYEGDFTITLDYL